jgi:serine/threonine protein kinase/tetratricopeptide (TPR) repeat protein
MNMQFAREVNQLFKQVLDQPPDERDEFLRARCGSRPELLSEVKELLARLDEADRFLETPLMHRLPSTSANNPAEELIGQRIGQYTIQSVIASGGMGMVFRAEQDNPRRQVALKLMRSGLAAPALIRRFDYEAQVLGLLQHPHIAQVYEASAHRIRGLGMVPFFAMEYLEGSSWLTTFAENRGLSLRERLRLFIQVCDAVQHAHQKGVIHRDLKPSNILVVPRSAPAGDDASEIALSQCKVIDFGVAKAVHFDERDITFSGAVVGTPEYMSPEQAGGMSDIDTRTDIYNLGLILYELLTGTRPYDRDAIQQAGPAEVQRLIQQVEPTKPSTRLRQINALQDGISSIQGEGSGLTTRLNTRDLRSWTAGVRGDLDWIVMKCLEKERSRRYATANGLALDVRRYLDDQPVLAGPPGTSYRLRKLIVRHRRFVAAATMTAAALVIGSAIAITQAVRAHHQANRAEQQRQLAERREDETRQVSEFQARMLRQIDAANAGEQMMRDIRNRHNDALSKTELNNDDQMVRLAAFERELAFVNATDTAADMIDRTILRPGISAIENEFAAQPLVDAALCQTLADLYSLLGRYEDAKPLQERALTIRRRELGNENRDTLISIHRMGTLLQGMGLLDRSEQHLREALNGTIRVLGESDAQTISVIGDMGFQLRLQGKLYEAEPYYRWALEKNRQLLGDQHQQTLASIHNMGTLLQTQGRFKESIPFVREALEQRRAILGHEHPETVSSIHNMAAMLHAMGKLEEAEPYFREGLETRRRLLGDSHPNTLNSAHNLGVLLQDIGKKDQAEVLLREAVSKRTWLLGEEHPSTLKSVYQLGMLFKETGRYDEADRCYTTALDARRRILGDDHPDTIDSISSKGQLLQTKGKFLESEPYVREALRASRLHLGETHPDTLNTISHLAGLLSNLGKLKQAESCFRELLQAWGLRPGDSGLKSLSAQHNLGSVLLAQGKPVEAEFHLRKALRGRRAALGERHADTVNSLSSVGGVLTEQHRLNEALKLYSSALDIYRTSPGNPHPESIAAIFNMGKVLRSQGKLKQAEPFVYEAYQLNQRLFGDDHIHTLRSLQSYCKVLSLQGEFRSAEANYRQLIASQRRTLGEDHKETLSSLHGVAFVLQSRGILDEAESIYQEILFVRRRELGNEHRDTLALINNLGYLMMHRRQYEKALTYFREAVETKRRVAGECEKDTLISVLGLASSLRKIGRLEESLDLLVPAAECAETQLPPRHRLRRAIIDSVIDLYKAGHRDHPHWGYDEQALAWSARL